VTVFDLLERLGDVRQLHPDIADWALHVVVPDGCAEWAHIALEEIEIDSVNKRVRFRTWSDDIDGPDDDESE
jgi:hypothetical protein